MGKARLWIAAALMAGILVRPESAVAGAQRAMALWCTSVAPSLFPFLALLPALTGSEACAAYDFLLSGAMRRAFHLPGAAAPAVVVGMIAGSPGGAIAITRVAQSANLHPADARRIALAVSGVSPAYLILGVGHGLYGSMRFGCTLAAIQFGIQLALLFLLRGVLPAEGGLIRTRPMENRGPDGMLGAVERMLTICGYMVFFGAIASVLASFAGRDIGLASLLVLDLPSGLAELAGRSFPGRMLIQGAAIGFGGLCIAAQNLDALREVGVRPRQYLAVRGVAAALFGCVSGIALRAQEASCNGCFEKAGLTYAASLVAACAAAVPGLIFLSKEFFLNKER